MNALNILKVLKSYGIITFGVFLYCFSWCAFIIPKGISGGGVTGVAGAIGGGVAGGLTGALQGSRVGNSFAWSLDPQMSKYASEGWEKDFLSLMQKK